MAARRQPSRLRALALLAALVWLLVGLGGVGRYVHAYWLYRGFPPPSTPHGIASGTTQRVRFYSRALHAERTYLVYRPPHYAALVRRGVRFPVMYLLHAPPGRPDGYLQAGALGVDVSVLCAHREIRPALYVIPFGKSGTYNDDTEWANTRAGRYEDFVLDVVRDVDHRFPTLRNRQDRAIAGLSEGGYGAVNIALHHLDLFSIAQSWSGYFVQTATGPFVHATPAELYDNSPGLYLPRLQRAIRHMGLRAYLYQGVKDEIRPFRIRTFGTQLRQVGAYVRWGFFPGGHDWGLWRHQMPHMLKIASRWFSQAPRHHGASPLHGIGRPEHPRAGHANPASPGHRAHRRRVAA
jgi:enterochelin esterase-like enzyme